MASTIAGDGAAAAGLPTPEEVANDPSVCRNQTYLGHVALRQSHLPIREGELGLTSSDAIKGTAYIGCLRPGKPAISTGTAPRRLMASALIDELKALATALQRCDMEEVVGTTWAALAAGEDPHVRRSSEGE